MLESYIPQIVGYVLSFTVAGVCGWLLARVKRLGAQDKAMRDGMKAVLRKELIDDYEKYVANGRNQVMTVERRHEIDEVYRAYETLGGNGTGKAMYAELCKIEVSII